MNANKPVQSMLRVKRRDSFPRPATTASPSPSSARTRSVPVSMRTCLQQALNSRGAPGVTDLVLNPDAHAGYGAPRRLRAHVADAHLSPARSAWISSAP